MQIQIRLHEINLAGSTEYASIKELKVRSIALVAKVAALNIIPPDYFAPLEPQFDGVDDDKYTSVSIFKNNSTKLAVSDTELIALTASGLQFKYVREILVHEDISKQLIAIAEKPIELVATGGNQYNTTCNVHMPGQALSVYNEVLLLENECTDNLQSSLHSGWRIIAACPQPDQRRPDYILGRYNPKLSITDAAARK